MHTLSLHDALPISGGEVTPVTAAMRLGALAAVVCRTEMERVENEKKAAEEASRGGGSGGFEEMMADEGSDLGGGDEESMAEMFDMGGGEGGGGGGEASNLSDQQKEELSYTKRMLKYRLYYVQRGLGDELAKAGNVTKTGLFAKVTDAQRPQVKQIHTMVAGILIELDPAPPEDGKPLVELDRDQLLQKLRKQVRQLEAFTAQGAGNVQAKSDEDALPGVGIPAKNN